MGEEIRVDYLDEDRYERSKRISWLNMDGIEKTRVLVVGAGALGNEVCKDLVLAGFKNISLVDMDYVVRSNLNRCLFFREVDAEERRFKAEVVAKGMQSLSEGTRIRNYTKKIQDFGEDFIPSHDIVLGCLDNIATRLHVNSHCYRYRIPYIDGAMHGLIGKVQVVLPPETSCLECGMNKSHSKILEERFSCTGENVTFYEPKLAAEITTTSIVSAVQVREGMKVASQREDLTIRNVFYYDGVRNVSDVLEIPLNESCPNHPDPDVTDSTHKAFLPSDAFIRKGGRR